MKPPTLGCQECLGSPALTSPAPGLPEGTDCLPPPVCPPVHLPTWRGRWHRVLWESPCPVSPPPGKRLGRCAGCSVLWNSRRAWEEQNLGPQASSPPPSPPELHLRRGLSGVNTATSSLPELTGLLPAPQWPAKGPHTHTQPSFGLRLGGSGGSGLGRPSVALSGFTGC